jgi:hypothetical protein
MHSVTLGSDGFGWHFAEGPRQLFFRSLAEFRAHLEIIQMRGFFRYRPVVSIDNLEAGIDCRLVRLDHSDRECEEKKGL